MMHSALWTLPYDSDAWRMFCKQGIIGNHMKLTLCVALQLRFIQVLHCKSGEVVPEQPVVSVELGTCKMLREEWLDVLVYSD